LKNWGWSIVALVSLLKIAFYWLNAAYASMAKMKAINPKIMEMRERLKDKPQEQQQMMKIYRDEKVNLMGGFPIMVQILAFIALYWYVQCRDAQQRRVCGSTTCPHSDPFFILSRW
jgi:YidC/Oxa1 family membrane protein insertase